MNPAGSYIRVSVRVEHPGSSCPVTTITRRDVFVDAVRHHVMTFQHGTYLLPLLRGYGSTVRVAVVVRALAGSDLVVHAQGTTTAVSPRLALLRLLRLLLR